MDKNYRWAHDQRPSAVEKAAVEWSGWLDMVRTFFTLNRGEGLGLDEALENATDYKK
jgi:hypothetical protein